LITFSRNKQNIENDKIHIMSIFKSVISKIGSISVNKKITINKIKIIIKVKIFIIFDI
jgi:hypothetical protein